jgi:hypothetical protein
MRMQEPLDTQVKAHGQGAQRMRMTVGVDALESTQQEVCPAEQVAVL